MNDTYADNPYCLRRLRQARARQHGHPEGSETSPWISVRKGRGLHRSRVSSLGGRH